MGVKGSDNRCAVYVRVSTEEQSREGVSIAAQLEKIAAYCRDRGLQIAEVIRDCGVSGGKYLSTRPGGARLVELVERERVAHVVALKLDRLFRNAGDALMTIEKWDARGVSTHLLDFAGQTLNTADPFGKLTLTMVAGFAELERLLTQQRTRDALQYKKAQKQKYCRGIYGYIVDDRGQLVRDDTEQAGLALAQSLRANGKSLRAIAAALTEAGYRPKRGEKWYASSVRSVLATAASF